MTSAVLDKETAAAPKNVFVYGHSDVWRPRRKWTVDFKNSDYYGNKFALEICVDGAFLTMVRFTTMSDLPKAAEEALKLMKQYDGYGEQATTD